MSGRVDRSQSDVPLPTTMPVDSEEWGNQLNLSNFVNSYYQYRDVQSLPGIRKILVVGPGQGLDTAVLRWRGYEVTTLDVDATFRPDHVASVHEMPFFGDAQFDLVIASHVIEHFAVAYLDQALRELARVARFALIYVPVHGLCVQFRFFTNFRGVTFAPTFDVFNYMEKPDGKTPRYMEGQHFWEVGMRGFRVRDLASALPPRSRCTARLSQPRLDAELQLRAEVEARPMKIIYSFNKKGAEGEAWTRQIAAGSRGTSSSSGSITTVSAGDVVHPGATARQSLLRPPSRADEDVRRPRSVDRAKRGRRDDRRQLLPVSPRMLLSLPL